MNPSGVEFHGVQRVSSTWRAAASASAIGSLGGTAICISKTLARQASQLSDRIVAQNINGNVKLLGHAKLRGALTVVAAKREQHVHIVDRVHDFGVEVKRFQRL